MPLQPRMSIPERFRTTVALREPDQVPVVVGTSGPVLMEFARLTPEEFYFDKKKALRAVTEFQRRFPKALLKRGLRPDYRNAEFLSGFGFEVAWEATGPRVDVSSKKVTELEVPDPYKDGMMPRVLEELTYFVEKTDAELKETHGDLLWVVEAQGPMGALGDLIGYTELFAKMYEAPAFIHESFETLTRASIAWLQAQERAFREAGVVPGRLFVFDEALGLVSPSLLKEYFLPYITRIFGASSSAIKIFHCDLDVSHIPQIVTQMGANVYDFNFSDAAILKRVIGRKMCLEGNVNAVEVLLKGAPTSIEEACRETILSAGHGGGFILGPGGGLSTGTPLENIDALINSAEKFGRYPLPPAPKPPAKRPTLTRPGVTLPRQAVQRGLRPEAERLLENIADLVLAGKAVEACQSIQKAIQVGLPPQQILMEGMGKGIAIAAEKYYRREYFLPEMVRVNRTFQRGVELLEPHLAQGDAKGKVVIGTVKGNVMESGIALIAAMLRGAGFLVHNLGVNVAAERFVEEALGVEASIIAMGVYTTNRLPVVAEVAGMIRAKRLPLKTLAGGKGIDRETAQLIGVDAYAEDGYEAIAMALELVSPA